MKQNTNQYQTSNKIALIISFWMFVGNIVSFIYMSTYSHVSGVATFQNWCPSMFSLLSSIILVTALMLERFKPSNQEINTDPNTRKFKMRILGAIGLVLQLTSVIVLSIINCDAVGEAKLKLDYVNFHDLKLGTIEDIDAMVQILSTFSTSYNWLITCCVSFIMILHIKF